MNLTLLCRTFLVLLFSITLVSQSFGFNIVNVDTVAKPIFLQTSDSEIREKLANALEAELPATEIVITDNAASDIEFLITQATNRLKQDNADEEKIAQAVETAKRLGRELKAHGTRREDGRIRIDRATVAGIRDWFCPAYPFCK